MWVKRILVFGICIAALLSGCGPEAPSSSRLAEVEATPSREATIPTPEPTFISPLPTLTPSPEPTVVVPLPTASPLPEPTEVYTDIISIPTTPTPIPTPDVHATTVPELDNIAFVNPRPLQLPEEVADRFKRDLLGLLVWSPDSQCFIGALHSGTLSAGNLERPVLDLLMGDSETGEIALWKRNAGWPSWSRDGRFVYYVAIRSDEENFYYDLYRRPVDSEESELVIQDVGIPSRPQPAALETETGELLVLSPERQPALVRLVNGRPALVSVASLPGLQSLAGRGTFFSLAPDGHTMAVFPDMTDIHVADLKTREVRVVQDSESSIDTSVAWSTDSRYLAFAGSQGVFIYDLETNEVRELITRQDLGFPGQDIYTGFGVIAYSPDEQVLLFDASTPDWSDYGGPAPVGIRFAATLDGSHWKAVSSQYRVDAMAPDKSRAIMTDWSDWPEAKQYLVDIVWK